MKEYHKGLLYGGLWSAVWLLILYLFIVDFCHGEWTVSDISQNLSYLATIEINSTMIDGNIQQSLGELQNISMTLGNMDALAQGDSATSMTMANDIGQLLTVAMSINQLLNDGIFGGGGSAVEVTISDTITASDDVTHGHLANLVTYAIARNNTLDYMSMNIESAFMSLNEQSMYLNDIDMQIMMLAQSATEISAYTYEMMNLLTTANGLLTSIKSNTDYLSDLPAIKNYLSTVSDTLTTANSYLSSISGNAAASASRLSTLNTTATLIKDSLLANGLTLTEIKQNTSNLTTMNNNIVTMTAGISTMNDNIVTATDEISNMNNTLNNIHDINYSGFLNSIAELRLIKTDLVDHSEDSKTWRDSIKTTTDSGNGAIRVIITDEEDTATPSVFDEDAISSTDDSSSAYTEAQNKANDYGNETDAVATSLQQAGNGSFLHTLFNLDIPALQRDPVVSFNFPSSLVDGVIDYTELTVDFSNWETQINLIRNIQIWLLLVGSVWSCIAIFKTCLM